MVNSQDVLIDNATLTGAQRLLGQAVTGNLYNIDNDICCFEKLVSAILFGERLFAVDDYKPEYRDARIKGFPFIEFISPSTFSSEAFANEAAAYASDTAFAFEGSKPVGEALAFFETLQLRPQMRWSVFVSSEYLTLSYLVAEKHDPNPNRMSAAFGNELGDHERSITSEPVFPALSIETSTGKKHLDDVKSLVAHYTAANPGWTGMGHRDTLQKIIFGYGWIAERSYYYSAVADQLGVSSALSPLRDAFCETTFRLDHKNEINVLLEQLSSKAQSAVATISEAMGDTKFAYKVPFFTAYLLSKTGNTKEALDLALHLRSEPGFIRFRGMISNLQHLDVGDRRREVNSIARYLNEECELLLKKYCVDSGQGPAFGVSLGLSGPAIDWTPSLARLFRNHRHGPIAKIFKSLAREMLNVERLGANYEKAKKLVREHKEAMLSQVATTPDFMESRSNEYGRPALPKQ